VFFLCLTIWLISRTLEAPGRLSGWFTIGLALGCLSLTRENALLLVGVIFVWIVTHFRRFSTTRLKFAAAVSLGLAIVLLPVATRNKIVGGEFHLTTSQFGPNFFIGNNERADGTYMSLRFGRGAPEYERQDATELAEQVMGRRLTPGEVSDYWTRRALTFITTQPFAWLRLMGRKFILVWNATEVIDTESLESHTESSPVLRATALIGHFGALVPLALFGVVATWKRRRDLWLLHALLVTYTASVVIFYVFARYRFPMVPFLVLFAAAGLVELRSFGEWWRPTILRGASPLRAAIMLSAVALVAVFCNWPLLSPTVMQAVSETNLGTGLQAAGRLDEAIQHYRRATELKPDHAPAYTNMGTALRLQGRLDEAIVEYRRALEFEPAYVTAQYNLANALLEQGDASQAVEQFHRALARQPDSVEIYNNLGIAYDTLGRHDEALRTFRKAIELDPNSAEAHYNAGNVLSTQGAPDEAIGEFRRALELRPDYGAAHYELGNTLLALGKLAEAIDHFERALSITPDFADAHNNLGIALGSQGELDDAIRHFQEALRINPAFENAKQNLTMALAARQK
jgi:tetratricopeptide (TPR) repeat protein